MAIRINFGHVISHLGRITSDVAGLAADVQVAQSDPTVKAELESAPATKALLDDISQKLRDLQNAVS